MAGKPQMEHFQGVGDRIAALLRRHPTIGTAAALGRVADLSRQTLHRAMNEDVMTRVTGRAIADALGVRLESLIGEARADVAVADVPVARHARHLPLAIREYLAEFELRLLRSGATEEEMAEAIALLQASANFVYNVGGTQREYGEDDVLRGMKGIGEGVIVPELRERGRNIK